MSDNTRSRKVNFGTRTGRYEKSRFPRTGGGGYASWRNKFRPDHADDNPKGTPIIIVRGEYLSPLDFDGEYVEDPTTRPVLDYDTYITHKIRSRNKRGEETFDEVMCTAGFDPHNKKPCIGCYLVDTKKENWISRNIQYYFTIIVLRNFHTVQLVNKKGEPVTTKKGEPVMVEEPCAGRRCEYCERGIETHFGRRMFWQMGSSHRKQLEGIAVALNQECATCGGEAYVAQYVCPECGDMAIDMGSKISDDQVTAMISRPVRCENCGARVMLEEVYECDNTNCKDPRPLSFFDETVIWLNKIGENTGSTVQRVKHKPVVDFLEPAELARVKELAVPYDFSKGLYFIRDLNEQAQKFGVENPWAKSTDKVDASEYNTNELD